MAESDRAPQRRLTWRLGDRVEAEPATEETRDFARRVAEEWDRHDTTDDQQPQRDQSTS